MATQAQKQAFEYSWEGPDDEDAIWQSLRYLLKLHELDPKAVTVQLPLETGEDFIRFIFESIEEMDDSGKPTLSWQIFELHLGCIYNQTQAADFCKTSTRTIQRWTSKDLNHVRHKNIVLYEHDDLEDYMDKIGHHPGMQRVGRYGHRVKD